MEDGVDRPIALVSRTLTLAEKKYSQLEKEGLAVAFGVCKFNQYLMGRSFAILSDHKPLQYLFSADRPVRVMTSARIQRRALTLSVYQYDIAFKAGGLQGNVDALSRLPLEETPSSTPLPGVTVLMLEALGQQRSSDDCRDQGLDGQGSRAIARVWFCSSWELVASRAGSFRNKELELSVHDGCLLWGNRAMVPKPGRKAVLGMLHDSHPSITRMKALARDIVWWPGIDGDDDC